MHFKRLLNRWCLPILLAVALLIPGVSFADKFDVAMAALSDGDYRQAYRGFKRLAQRDHVESQYQLGMLYLFGQGAKQDTAQGISWLEQAALNGNYLAAHELGQIYIAGRGVAPNELEAMKWVELATEIAEENEGEADDGCE